MALTIEIVGIDHEFHDLLLLANTDLGDGPIGPGVIWAIGTGSEIISSGRAVDGGHVCIPIDCVPLNGWLRVRGLGLLPFAMEISYKNGLQSINVPLMNDQIYVGAV